VDVTIFTGPGCVSCQRAKAFLRDHQIEFTERDVAADPAAVEELVKRGCRRLPVILIDGDVVQGFDLQDLVQRLRLPQPP